MIGMGSGDCPIVLNFDPETFKSGDLVSYRVPESFGDNPFVGVIVEVAAETIVIKQYGDESPDAHCMRATRVSRPVVALSELET